MKSLVEKHGDFRLQLLQFSVNVSRVDGEGVLEQINVALVVDGENKFRPLLVHESRRLRCRLTEHFQSENVPGHVNTIEFLFSGKEDESAMREYTLTRYLTEMADTI
jgi:hypothetical protein